MICFEREKCAPALLAVSPLWGCATPAKKGGGRRRGPFVLRGCFCLPKGRCGPGTFLDAGELKGPCEIEPTRPINAGWARIAGRPRNQITLAGHVLRRPAVRVGIRTGARVRGTLTRFAFLPNRPRPLAGTAPINITALADTRHRPGRAPLPDDDDPPGSSIFYRPF